MVPSGKSWEFGSEFHWPFAPSAAASGPVLPTRSRLYASGRDAIRALIAAGRRGRGWQRWLVPTYFCEEVTAAIASTGIAVVRYEDSPLWPAPPPLKEPLKSGDALILVNYFGLRGPEAVATLDLGPADLIEDHTHDPWSQWARDSRAAYGIASYRKTLPVPGGAVIWSPRHLPLPDVAPVTRERYAAIMMKTGAAMLKALYLEGHVIDKETYRALQLAGEARMASGDVAGLEPWAEKLLDSLPWESWRRQRRRNHAVLAESLRGLAGLEVLPPFDHAGSCPYAVVLKFECPELRDSMRASLLARAIYPAVLWPIADRGCPELAEAARLAARILTLACDFRYQETDLRRVADGVCDVVRDWARPAGAVPEP